MGYSNLHIDELLILCKAHNKGAQYEIYHRYSKAMYNTAFRILKNSFEAEDAMQEAFLKAFKKIESCHESSSFGSWLKKIVVNESLYQYNKKSKKEELPLEESQKEIDKVSMENHSLDYAKLKAQEVMEAISFLKENYQIAINLHLIEGYDYEELSDILKISNANSRTLISRAKEQLRNIIIQKKNGK